MSAVARYVSFALLFCGLMPGPYATAQPADSLVKLPAHTEGIRRIDLLNKLSEQQQGIDAEKALTYAREAMRIAIDQGDEARTAVATINIGVVYRNVGQTGKALETFMDALSIAERIGNRAIEADALHKIGVTYLFVNEFDEALLYGKKEEAIWNELQDSTGLANAYNFLGLIYLNQNRLSESAGALNRSLDLAKRLGDKNLMYKPLVNLGDLYIRNRDGITAETTIRQSLDISRAMGNTFGEAVALQKLGVALRLQHRFSESARALQDALARAQQIRSLSLVRNTFRDMAQLNEETGDYRASLDLYRQYIALEDSIFNQLTRRKVAEATARYEIEKKEAENERLRMEAARNRRLLLGASAAGLIILALSLYLYLMYRRQRIATDTLRELNVRVMSLNDEVGKQKNELQHQNLALSEMNVKKDRFFSIMAHDVRASFTGILGYSETLSEEIETLSPEQRRHMARRIHQSARAVNGLFENLLQWSRLELNEIQPAPGPVILRNTVEGLIDIFRLNSTQKDLRIAVEVPAGLEIVTDEYILSTVLRNLLSNAIKYSHPGGDVVVRASQEGGRTVISVVDKGVGIPAEHLSNLFALHGRKSRPGTQREKGTGLGLHVCRRLAEKIGAELQVDSTEGKGTTVRFVI